MRLLFEGGFYSRAAFIGEFTVYIRKRCSYCQKSETSHCCNRCTLRLPSTRGIFKSNCFVFEVSEALSLALREGRKVVFKPVSVRQLPTWIIHAWLFVDIFLCSSTYLCASCRYG